MSTKEQEAAKFAQNEQVRKEQAREQEYQLYRVRMANAESNLMSLRGDSRRHLAAEARLTALMSAAGRI